MSGFRRGFTIIELLVVIAVIGVLAALIVPVCSTTREKSRQITCASNLGQIGMAIQAYQQDYGGAYPGLVIFPLVPTWSLYEAWDSAIMPYVGKPGVFRCPDDPSIDFDGTAGSPPSIVHPEWGRVRSYAANIDWWYSCAPTGAGLGDCWGDAATPLAKREAQLPSPASSILITERFGPGTANYLGSSGWADVWALPNSNNGIVRGVTQGTPYAIHTGGNNYLFCDGHVKRYSLEQTDTDARAGVHSASDLGFWDIRQY